MHLCFTPTSASWANPTEAQFEPLRTFTMSGSNHPHHTVLARRLQDYLTWRNANARHPHVLAGQRRERARSERRKRIHARVTAGIPGPKHLNKRRERSYPRVVKRARHNHYPVKKSGKHGTRHDGPPPSNSPPPYSPGQRLAPQHDQDKPSGIGGPQREPSSA